MTGVVHVTSVVTGPEFTYTEDHSYPWPGRTAADILREERYRACRRGGVRTSVRDIGAGVTVTEHVTVTDDEDRP